MTQAGRNRVKMLSDLCYTIVQNSTMDNLGISFSVNTPWRMNIRLQFLNYMQHQDCCFDLSIFLIHILDSFYFFIDIKSFLNRVERCSQIVFSYHFAKQMHFTNIREISNFSKV